MDRVEKIENCPHCGIKLSPWQKVLLNVDRAIMCKNCWYRIIIESDEPANNNLDDSKENDQKRGKDGNL